MEFVIAIAIVILSIILHEVAHGYVADWLGDPTARLSGRLTLNPIPHLDPVGSILIPGMLALSHSPFLIGWAKPVPYNPYQVRGGVWGEAAVAAAGPATNILIAIALGLLLRFGFNSLSGVLISIVVSAVYANLVLAIFNLIPLPPLDGSKVLRALLRGPFERFYQNFERAMYAFGPFGLIAVSFVAIYLLWPVVGYLVQFLFFLITGLTA